MYGLGGLLRSRLYEDYHTHDYVDLDRTKDISRKKQKVTKAVLQQINRRDIYLAEALQVTCVYEITQSRDIFNAPVEVQGLTLSNYALTVLNMHIGNLSAKLQKLKQLLHKVLHDGGVARSKKTSLKMLLAEECKALAVVLEQGAKVYGASFKLKLNRYYENMQVLQLQARSSSEGSKSKKQKNPASLIQKGLEKGMTLQEHRFEY
jgi:hypothetical protein